MNVCAIGADERHGIPVGAVKIKEAGCPGIQQYIFGRRDGYCNVGTKAPYLLLSQTDVHLFFSLKSLEALVREFSPGDISLFCVTCSF